MSTNMAQLRLTTAVLDNISKNHPSPGILCPVCGRKYGQKPIRHVRSHLPPPNISKTCHCKRPPKNLDRWLRHRCLHGISAGDGLDPSAKQKRPHPVEIHGNQSKNGEGARTPLTVAAAGILLKSVKWASAKHGWRECYIPRDVLTHDIEGVKEICIIVLPRTSDAPKPFVAVPYTTGTCLELEYYRVRRSTSNDWCGDIVTAIEHDSNQGELDGKQDELDSEQDNATMIPLTEQGCEILLEGLEDELKTRNLATPYIPTDEEKLFSLWQPKASAVSPTITIPLRVGTAIVRAYREGTDKFGDADSYRPKLRADEQRCPEQIGT